MRVGRAGVKGVCASKTRDMDRMLHGPSEEKSLHAKRRHAGVKLRARGRIFSV